VFRSVSNRSRSFRRLVFFDRRRAILEMYELLRPETL